MSDYITGRLVGVKCVVKEKYGPNKSEEKVGKAFQKLGIIVYYQYNFGPYTLDLFLPKYNVCIEVYGPHHIETKRQRSDIARQQYIEAKGIKVYIITAQEANTTDGVKSLVNQVLSENNIPLKGKKEDIFNKDLHDRLEQWVNNTGFSMKPVDCETDSKTKKEKAVKEEDFGALLDRYYPEKSIKNSSKK